MKNQLNSVFRSFHTMICPNTADTDFEQPAILMMKVWHNTNMANVI